MRLLFVLGAAAIAITVSSAALADEKSDCMVSKDNDLRIKGCTAIIERSARDAFAYHNRGTAYYLNGDLDRAIADLNKAIELNPKYAPTYDIRARAYASKGDFTHAVADTTKATELNDVAPAGAPKKAASKEANKSSAPNKAKAVAKTNPAAKQTVAKEVPANTTTPEWARKILGN